jgi:uncharacterized membrane protein
MEQYFDLLMCALLIVGGLLAVFIVVSLGMLFFAKPINRWID